MNRHFHYSFYSSIEIQNLLRCFKCVHVQESIMNYYPYRDPLLESSFPRTHPNSDCNILRVSVSRLKMSVHLFYPLNWFSVLINPYPSIMDHHRACIAGTKSRLNRFVCVSVLWNFFQKWRSVTARSSKNGIYFCSVRHIFSHFGICH